MSWLQPSERDTEYFAQLQDAEHEQLYRYAQVLAMAARIDSHLLRSLRLRFLPDSPVELELALWFSDVISSRNATGADMYPGVARLLCDELWVDVGQYERVKSSVKQLTQHWRTAEQLEQTMRWAVLEDDTDALQLSYQRILHQLQVTDGAFEKREIARWAKGALATTLDKGQPLQEATWLYQYVAATLGSPGQWLEKRDVEPLPDNLRMALPEGRPQKIGIRVYPGVLQFVKPDEGDLDVIEVDLPIPTSVQIRFDDGEPRWESVWYGRVINTRIENNRIDIKTLNGFMFHIETRKNTKPIRILLK